jgi:hypothetical protein
MNAKEVGGAGRTATVSGAAQGEYVNATIEVSSTAYDGKPLQIPRLMRRTSSGG